jgi:flagellar basal body P-ring protein FlgI
MRGLKFLVIFMGVLIILGTSFLVFTIVQRGSNLIKPTESEIKNSTIEINTPYKMKLINFTSNNANITVQFEDETKYIINIISIDSGVEIKKIIIKK